MCRDCLQQSAQNDQISLYTLRAKGAAKRGVPSNSQCAYLLKQSRNLDFWTLASHQASHDSLIVVFWKQPLMQPKRTPNSDQEPELQECFSMSARLAPDIHKLCHTPSS